ncbi:Acyl transferase domain-containing protein [Actinacidiphila yanglinensis]|uniref:Acyl transferase domain-containing protein n=1 Tax=Actinacidiphila yanglinensis TaxID=310779 RepID=A0A1H5SQU2_9ACTN|nr:type I polyketide synthase [Actinacidiphila yanglinensis]SEF53002.1 Acyl transferase domain-containing protein [Actinacidiphila yanglinensis]
MSGAATDVAVIGMACRFPGVGGPEEFWRLLLDGRSTVGTFPLSRRAGAQPAPHPDAATVAAGSFFDAVDGFDAEFFGAGPAEAAAMDPVQRLGLELAWEAVEDARVPAAALAGRAIDVLVGAAPSGYDVLRRLSGSDRDDHYAALGSSGALIANRISHLLDVRGMSLCADSGQSSSLVSLALACDRIRGGTVDMAIVGGVNLIVDPEAGLGLANLGALSPDGRCFTFDERASGFVRGEGGAFVVLKRSDLAVADGDHVYAVVRGWSVGSGGASARMPDPSPGAQAATVLSALERSGVPFDTVDYVEAHGTGTRVGDPAEIAGLREVFRTTGRSRPLAIGSAKTNVGHLEPAAGIVGFVKAALCVERARLVPHLNFRAANPAIPDFPRDFDVPRAPRPWPDTSGRPRRAGVSAFGLGGTNAHVVLEQAPDARPEPSSAETESAPAVASGVVPWVLSARTEPALREQAARLRDRLAADASLTAAEVGYALATTRSAFAHRAVVLGSGRDDALAGLDVLAAGGDAARVVRGAASAPTGPVVFVFPGQGSQWAGMGRRLYAESPVFAEAVEACARALDPWLDWSLVDVLTGAESAASLEHRDDVVQPALFAMMVSLARVWRSLGVVPDAVVGHSQGEIAAACVAGALSLEDAARIVALRSKVLTDLAGLGGMNAVSAPLDWVEERVARWPGRLSVAAVNGPGSVVISGDLEALDGFAAMAAGDGVRVRRVRIAYASHSHQVERIRDRVLEAAADVVPARTAVAFHSTVTGGVLDPQLLGSSYWYDNLRSKVRFGEVVEQLMRAPGGAFVEVSPHPVLAVAMEETADTLTTSPVLVGTLHKDDGSAGRILASLAELHVRGVPVDWKAPFAAHRPPRIGLPTYAFQRQPYWLAAPDDTHTTIPAPGSFAGGGGSAAHRPAVPNALAAELSSERSVLALVCAETAAVLSATDADAEDLTGDDLAARATETFKDLGFESSMAVRLRNRLTAAVGVRLPATVAFTHPTPQRLGRHLFSLLEPPAPAAAPEPAEEPRPAGPAGGDDELYALIDRGYV